jgi:DNA-binding protein H-NS
MKTLEGELFHTVERTAMFIVVVALLATNILSITSSPFHEALHKLLSHIPYEELLNNSPTKKQRQIAENQKLLKQNQELISKSSTQRERLVKTRHVSQRIVKRTAKNVATNVTSVAGEAVPYLGVGLVVTVTAADVIDGCDTVLDVNEMLRILEVEPIDDHESDVCGIKVPSVDEVLTNIKQDIGGTIYHAKEGTTESARKFYDALGGSLHEIFK